MTLGLGSRQTCLVWVHPNSWRGVFNLSRQTEKERRSRAEDYHHKHFFFYVLTCMDLLFTTRLVMCTNKVKRVNFDFMTTLILFNFTVNILQRLFIYFSIINVEMHNICNFSILIVLIDSSILAFEKWAANSGVWMTKELWSLRFFSIDLTHLSQLFLLLSQQLTLTKQFNFIA